MHGTMNLNVNRCCTSSQRNVYFRYAQYDMNNECLLSKLWKLRLQDSFDVNTYLKSVPGTPHVKKLKRHEFSSKLFRKHVHDVIVRSGSV
jgi:hypothetical protein